MTAPTQMTPLDRAFAAAEAPGAAPTARARFYALLAETDLCIPLDGAAEQGPLRPLVFPLDEPGPVALAFDDDGRMAAFFEAPTEYVRLSGRALLAALAQARLGLGLNLGDAPSATLLDAATVAFLAAEQGGAVEAAEVDGPITVGTPRGAERGLVAALAARLAEMPGLVTEAWLVTLERDGRTGLAAMALPGPLAARAAEGVAAALGRAAAAHAPEGTPVEIALLTPTHPLLAASRTHGLALHAKPEPGPEPSAPTRPDAPPRLR
jgi:hypothetical protein